MPEHAGGLTIRYEGSATDDVRSGHEIVTDHGFHHHVTHDHSTEVIDVYQPFELTDENEAIIEDLQVDLKRHFSDKEVKLKHSGKDRGDEVSVRYLFIIGNESV